MESRTAEGVPEVAGGESGCRVRCLWKWKFPDVTEKMTPRSTATQRVFSPTLPL